MRLSAVALVACWLEVARSLGFLNLQVDLDGCWASRLESPGLGLRVRSSYWVAVKELNLSY